MVVSSRNSHFKKMRKELSNLEMWMSAEWTLTTKIQLKLLLLKKRKKKK